MTLWNKSSSWKCTLSRWNVAAAVPASDYTSRENDLVCISHLSYVLHVPPISYPFIILIIFREAYKLWSFSLRSLLQSPASSSLLYPRIFFNTLLPGRVCLRSSLTARDQVSHPSKTTGKLINHSLNVPQINSARDFFINKILICQCRSQVFELWNIFEKNY